MNAFKFELGDIIHYFNNGLVHSAPVLARTIIENKLPAHTKQQEGIFHPFGPAGELYGTCHGTFAAADCHRSKADLMSSVSR